MRTPCVRKSINVEEQTRHAVDAVAASDSRVTINRYNRSVFVTAQWREGTQVRTESVAYPEIVKTGAHLQVWLDKAGKVVAPPEPMAAAEASGSGRAWAVWVASVGFFAVVALLIRFWLDRSRARAWERELLLLAYNDDGWANRHT